MCRTNYSRRVISFVVMILFVFTLACGNSSVPQSTSAPSSSSTSTYGLIFADEEEYAAVPPAPFHAAATQLPSRLSLDRSFPTVGQQGQQGSCVGWAVAYSLKTYQEAQERNWSLNSRNHQFSPSYIYNQIIQKQRGTCYRGIKIIDALDLVQREGVAPLSAFGYDDDDCATLPSNSVKQIARSYAIESYYRMRDLEDLDEIKGHIVSGFPLLVGMLVDKDFERLSGSTVWQFSGKALGGHAVVVIGYDNSKSAFRIINSWGSNWGDNGYGWISYNAFANAVREAYIVYDVIDNDPSPVNPTPRPPVETTTSCSIPVYAPFESVWLNRGGASISCPTGVAFTRNGAYEYFQNGLMIWHAGPQGDAGGMIYVIYNNGNWQEYSDRWVEGQSELACNPTPPNNLLVPKRGFGKIWCEKLGGSNANLGWATGTEQAATVTIQPFERTGVIISFPGNTYFLPDGKRWK